MMLPRLLVAFSIAAIGTVGLASVARANPLLETNENEGNDRPKLEAKLEGNIPLFCTVTNAQIDGTLQAEENNTVLTGETGETTLTCNTAANLTIGETTVSFIGGSQRNLSDSEVLCQTTVQLGEGLSQSPLPENNNCNSATSVSLTPDGATTSGTVRVLAKIQSKTNTRFEAGEYTYEVFLTVTPQQ